LYVISHDIGTSGDKAVLVDSYGKVRATAHRKYFVSYPKYSWAEQNPLLWWNAIKKTTKSLVDKSKISVDEILGISLSSQTNGIVPVDALGKAIRPCIIWLDGRGTLQSKWIENRIAKDRIYDITGTIVSPKAAIAKLLWLRQNEPLVFRDSHKILDPKGYLLHKLTGEFITDWTSACYFSLLDLRKRRWSEELCQSLNIPLQKLPTLKSPKDIVGELDYKTSNELGLKKGTVVVAGGGDTPCSVVGSMRHVSKKVQINIGSSAWVAITVGNPFCDPLFRIFNVPHVNEGEYVAHGSLETAGLCIEWFKSICTESMSKTDFEMLQRRAKKVPAGSHNLTFIPYMFGEKSVIATQIVKGGLLGLALIHKREEILRSIMEAIAYNIKWITENFREAGIGLDNFVLTGGAAKNELWVQIISDVIGQPVNILSRPDFVAALGAALTCLLGVKLISKYDDVTCYTAYRKTVIPDKRNQRKYSRLYDRYRETCRKLLNAFQ
jgi:xylulokinase